jgi:multidrug efflux pump subunit AcrB
MATYLLAQSVICVFLFMSALYESLIRPMVIILTMPLATFGAMVGLWMLDKPLDVFGRVASWADRRRAAV